LSKYSIIYYTLFSDELIRQVTVNCAERGLLLLRVRDEIKMTLAAYQTLYQSSIAFGMRKALQVPNTHIFIKFESIQTHAKYLATIHSIIVKFTSM